MKSRRQFQELSQKQLDASQCLGNLRAVSTLPVAEVGIEPARRFQSTGIQVPCVPENVIKVCHALSEESSCYTLIT